jgi:hypothetical protein
MQAPGLETVQGSGQVPERAEPLEPCQCRFWDTKFNPLHSVECFT